jgi:hypothetical protein
MQEYRFFHGPSLSTHKTLVSKARTRPWANTKVALSNAGPALGPKYM